MAKQAKVKSWLKFSEKKMEKNSLGNQKLFCTVLKTLRDANNVTLSI